MLKFFVLFCVLLIFVPASAQSIERGDIQDVAWSPDGTTLAVLADHGVWLYDTAHWDAPPRAILLDGVIVRNIVFSTDGSLLAVGAEPDVYVWDLETLTRVLLIEDFGGHVVFAPDGKHLYLVRNAVDKFALDTGEHVSHFGGDYWSMWGLAISPDGRWLVEGNTEEGCHIWDLATETLVADIHAYFTSLDFSPASTLVAVGRFDTGIELWDVTTQEMRLEISTQIEDTWLSDVAFHPDGTHLAAIYQDGKLLLANTETGAIIETIQAHNPPENNFIDGEGLAFHPDGTLLATGSDDGTVGIWAIDAEQINPVATLEGYTPQDSDWLPPRMSVP